MTNTEPPQQPPPSTTNPHTRWTDIRDRHLQEGFVNTTGQAARLRMQAEQREERDLDVSFHDGDYAGDDGGGEGGNEGDRQAAV